jgi:hypothetical protein
MPKFSIDQVFSGDDATVETARRGLVPEKAEDQTFSFTRREKLRFFIPIAERYSSIHKAS